MSMTAYEEFLNENYEEKMLNYCESRRCYQLAQLAYESFVENCGQQIGDQGI